MAITFLSPIFNPLIIRAAREIVGRLGQPAFLLHDDGTVDFVNPAACSAFGLDARTAKGRSIHGLIEGGGVAWGLREVLGRVQGGENSFQEGPFVLDASRAGPRVYGLSVVALRGHWFDTGLAVLTLQDETARHDAEQQLSAVLAAAPDAIVVVDEGGRIRLVNQQAISLFGYPEQELLDSAVEMLVPEAQRGGHPVHRMSYLVDPRLRPMGANLELTARRKDGTELPVDIALSPVETKDGLMTIAAVRDSCARRKVERDRLDLEAQLHDARRLEAIGRLAGGIAHDFNNLLTVVLGHSELALSVMDEADREHSGLRQVQAAARQGARLTQQLLAFGRRQVLQPAVVDPNAVVEGVMPMLHTLVREDIKVVAVLDPELGRVKIDPASLEQVITNLVLNGSDAMAGGGTVTIETKNIEIDEAYARQHPDVEPGSYVVIAVSDSGAGIEPGLLGEIFEPFFTTKGPGMGSGLGLATVHGIVKQSQGSVWAYSEPGAGTTFKVYLPRVDEPVDPRPEPEFERPIVGGTERLLVVEDDQAVRDFFRIVLEGLGYQVITTEAGKEALAAVPDVTGIDLLITDVVMPGLRGPELALRLRVSHPGLPVLYVSGYAENAIVHQGVLEPGLHFLSKPFTSTELARRVRAILDRSAGGM